MGYGRSRLPRAAALDWKESESPDTYEEPVRHRITHVRVIPVCAVLARDSEPISKRRTSRYWTLGDSGDTVGPIGAILIHAIWIYVIQCKEDIKPTPSGGLKMTHANLLEKGA